MERGKRAGSSQLVNGFAGGGIHRFGVRSEDRIAPATIPVSPASPSSSPSSSCGYIEHRVGKFDTLAGVAIKYGVEVADVKRLNGLSTDLQMFAHKTLRIPLPGRHPPSSYLPNSSSDDRERTPPRRPHNDVLDTLQSLKPPRNKVSPAMSLLQGYYGLMPPKGDSTHEGTEMTVYGKGKSVCLEDEPWLREPSNSEPLPFMHRKSKTRLGGFCLENGESNEERTVTAENGDSERSIRRRQKADQSPELLPREESIGGILARAGKGLALRPKSANQPDMNKSQQNLIAMGDSSFSDGFQTVRKSSSTPDFQDSDSSSSSIWQTSKWSLKPDAFALPLFDSLPKPIAAWRNKAARD